MIVCESEETYTRENLIGLLSTERGEGDTENVSNSTIIDYRLRFEGEEMTLQMQLVGFLV